MNCSFWPCGCATFTTGYWILCEKHAFMPMANGSKSLLPGGPEAYGESSKGDPRC